MKIAIVAGEHSGDVLGAGLITELKAFYPDATFYGIGGPKMQSLGFHSLYDMSRLSVFGLFEVLKHLPSLLSLRAELVAGLLKDRPDVFIGIDAPDFNLNIEKKLHASGIKTIHYVSPTVWAWRPKRIKKLIGTLNALLCIFPFEATYFKDKNVPATYIGHPLADKLSRVATDKHVEQQSSNEMPVKTITLMPGSRLGEIERHTELFLETVKQCQSVFPNLKVLVPMPDNRTAEKCGEYVSNYEGQLDITVKVINASDFILASDIVLVASGTATLEIMLLNRPMVVAYKVAPMTAWLIKTFSLLNVPYVSMPNLVANDVVVPEYLQEAATPEALSSEVIELLSNDSALADMLETFSTLKKTLTCHADYQAAKVVHQVIEGASEKA